MNAAASLITEIFCDRLKAFWETNYSKGSIFTFLIFWNLLLVEKSTLSSVLAAMIDELLRGKLQKFLILAASMQLCGFHPNSVSSECPFITD